MSIFQNKVDELIKKELENLKKNKKNKEDEAKEIHRKETTQAKINKLIEAQKDKKDD